MPTIHADPMQSLRRAILLPVSTGFTDEQLLDRFVERQDEIAFEIIVRRHGPMVMGVCRRLLRHETDADDAFQATFLVLVRKAASIWPRSMLGNWLYGVAWKIATKARAIAARRGKRERQVTTMPEPEAASHDEAWSDLRPLLDKALKSLPDKYRAPIVLCDLERKTQKEAARQLGWPEGTLAVRLMRARKALAKRLSRHGVLVTSSSLALLLTQNASARVPPSLVSAAVKAASLIAAGQIATAAISLSVTSLTEGVLKAMVMKKIKIVAAALVTVVVLASGSGLIARNLPAEQHVEAKKEVPNSANPPIQAAVTPKTETVVAKSANEKLRGTWRVVSLSSTLSPPKVDKWIIGKDSIIMSRALASIGQPYSGQQEATYRLWGDHDDAAPAANFINLTIVLINTSPDGEKSTEGESTYRGIFEWEGEKLKLCFRRPLGFGPGTRPTEIPQGAFKSNELLVLVLERENNPTPITDEEKLQGNWKIVGMQGDKEGFVLDAEQIAMSNWVSSFTFDANRLTFPMMEQTAHFQLDTTKTPKQITIRIIGTALTINGKRKEIVMRGIYALDGDDLKLCYASYDPATDVHPPVPVDFAATKGTSQMLFVLKRQLPEQGGSESVNGKKALKVGKILVVGNEKIQTELILFSTGLKPGQTITDEALKMAEKILAGFYMFVVDPEKNIRPTVTIIESQDASEYRDILVTVKEKVI